MLSKRTRIDVYIPERKNKVYARLLKAIESEFVYAFGGCTVIEGIRGLYLDSDEKSEADTITRVYSDIAVNLDEHFNAVAAYAEAICSAAAEALPEESILVTVEPVYHSV